MTGVDSRLPLDAVAAAHSAFCWALNKDPEMATYYLVRLDDAALAAVGLACDVLKAQVAVAGRAR